jgi:uncharacterized protein GlcG (DUF336 family)
MVTLAKACVIADKALEKGRILNLHPLSVAVLDASGCLVVFKREDHSALLREQIAQAKAWGALGLGIGGRGLAQRAASAPSFFNAISALSGGRIIPVPGGVLIRAKDRSLLGAVGVSGDLPDHDEACAIHGIELAGFLSDTGAPADPAVPAR